MADDQRLVNFFKESQRKPFSELESVLVVGVAKLENNTNLNAKNIFDNVPIYTIPDYVRGTNKKVKIPYPGVPFTVLTAKCGLQIRGIVKNLNDLKKKNDGKGKFPNQVTLDIALQDKVVNVMLFKNSMKITGAKRPGHLVETCIFIKALLSMMTKKGIKVWDKSLVLTKLNVVMENVVFDLGYKIRRKILQEKAKENDEIESPEEDDAVRILYPTGEEKAKGGKKYFNFRVLHTGKVVFSGPNRDKMFPVYSKFMNFIESNEAAIRFD